MFVYNLFVLFLVTPYLKVAIQHCMEGIPIKKWPFETTSQQYQIVLSGIWLKTLSLKNFSTLLLSIIDLSHGYIALTIYHVYFLIHFFISFLNMNQSSVCPYINVALATIQERKKYLSWQAQQNMHITKFILKSK